MFCRTSSRTKLLLTDLPKVKKRGFTLSELLVVLAIMGILAGLSVPALSGLSSADQVNRTVSDISMTLEQGRSYAMAHATYVWVGFYPPTGNLPLQVGIVAGNTGAVGDLTANYTAIAKMRSYNHFVLQNISLPGMDVGEDIANSTVGTFQQTSGGTSVTFTELLQFNPQGEATIHPDSIPHFIQIGLKPSGNAKSTDVAVCQVTTLTGKIQVFRP